jgi:hypothetical protein
MVHDLLDSKNDLQFIKNVNCTKNKNTIHEQVFKEQPLYGGILGIFSRDKDPFLLQLIYF